MKLPSNIWKSKAILKRLEQEARFEGETGISAKPHYWITVPEGDTRVGSITLRNYKPSFVDIDPHEMQQEFAYQVRLALQREYCHDGLWIVGYTHPPDSGQAVRIDGDNCWDRLIMIWLDEDADAQFTVESEHPFTEMLSYGERYYVGLAERAFAAWDEAYGKKAMKQDFGIKDSQINHEALKTLN